MMNTYVHTSGKTSENTLRTPYYSTELYTVGKMAIRAQWKVSIYICVICRWSWSPIRDQSSAWVPPSHDGRHHWPFRATFHMICGHSWTCWAFWNLIRIFQNFFFSAHIASPPLTYGEVGCYWPFHATFRMICGHSWTWWASWNLIRIFQNFFFSAHIAIPLNLWWSWMLLAVLCIWYDLWALLNLLSILEFNQNFLDFFFSGHVARPPGYPRNRL